MINPSSRTMHSQPLSSSLSHPRSSDGLQNMFTTQFNLSALISSRPNVDFSDQPPAAYQPPDGVYIPTDMLVNTQTNILGLVA